MPYAPDDGRIDRRPRRQDRILHDDEAWALLHRGEYGVLSVVAGGGRPYGVPLNYCVVGASIIFHSALEGHKTEGLGNGEWASFCVVGDTELMPERFGTKYESVIVAGRTSELFGAGKLAGLESLLEKYSRDHLREGSEQIRLLADRTRVFAIAIESLAGKARRS